MLPAPWSEQVFGGRLKLLPRLTLRADSLHLPRAGLKAEHLRSGGSLGSIRSLWTLALGDTLDEEIRLEALELAELRWKDLRFRQVESELLLQGSRLVGPGMAGLLFGEKVEGNWSVEPKGDWRLNLMANTLPMDSLWAMSGIDGRLEGELALDLRARPDSLVIRLESGACRLSDWPPLRELAERIGLRSAADYRADSLSADAVYHGESWSIRSLRLSGREGVLSGSGWITPHARADSAALDLELEWDLDAAALQEADLPRDLRRAAEWMADDQGRITLSFTLQGSLARPQAVLDGDSLREPLERGARRLFRRLFGG